MLVLILLMSFHLFWVFCVANIFLKNIWVCPASLIYYNTDLYPYSTPYLRIYFLPNLAPFFLPHLLIFICVPLLLSVKISSYLWSSVRIFSYSWLIICENLSWNLLAFYNLFQNKQAWECHHLRRMFYHQNMIMIICLLHMYQFCIICFEFFSFCVWLVFYWIKCLCIY